MSDFPVHNITAGIAADEHTTDYDPTHWKVRWHDRRGSQERLYNKPGTAKGQWTRLRRLGIEAYFIPCVLIELEPERNAD
jgi:hypothetical protein